MNNLIDFLLDFMAKTRFLPSHSHIRVIRRSITGLIVATVHGIKLQIARITASTILIIVPIQSNMPSIGTDYIDFTRTDYRVTVSILDVLHHLLLILHYSGIYNRVVCSFCCGVGCDYVVVWCGGRRVGYYFGSCFWHFNIINENTAYLYWRFLNI